jgi:predicted PurR-regulated permease PerM
LLRCAVAWGISLAFLPAPVHRWLVRRLKGRVGLSAGTITLQVPVLPAHRPAVLAALLALLSVGGDALVWVPAIVFASTSQLGSTIFQLIRGTGVSASDNLIRPFFISRQAAVSTLAVFVGVIGGLSAFGLIGVIIGPVLLTVMAALLRFVDETLSRQP